MFHFLRRLTTMNCWRLVPHTISIRSLKQMDCPPIMRRTINHDQWSAPKTALAFAVDKPWKVELSWTMDGINKFLQSNYSKEFFEFVYHHHNTNCSTSLEVILSKAMLDMDLVSFGKTPQITQIK